jgi:hypothetical protein
MMNVALRQEEIYSCAFLSLTAVSLRNPWAYHVLKDVELQGTDMDWGSLRIGHSTLLLRIAFSLILSYPTLLRYFREALLVYLLG